MTGTAFFESCIAFIENELEGHVRERVQCAYNVFKVNRDLDITVQLTPDAKGAPAAFALDLSGLSFEIQISRGLFVRLCYLTTVFTICMSPFYAGFRATDNWPHESSDIFHLCPELRPLFKDDYNDYEHWELLRTFHWSPLQWDIDQEQYASLVRKAEELLSKPINDDILRQALLAFDYLLFHEVSHVLLGHLHFHKRSLGSAWYGERSDPSRRLTPIVTQGLELDADIFAVHVMTRLHGAKMTNEAQVAPYNIFCAFGMVTTLFDIDSMSEVKLRSAESYLTSTHPMPEIRYALAACYWDLIYEKAPYRRKMRKGYAASYRYGWQFGLAFCFLASKWAAICPNAFPNLGSEFFVDFVPTLSNIVQYATLPATPLFQQGHPLAFFGATDRYVYEIARHMEETREELLTIQNEITMPGYRSGLGMNKRRR